MHKLMFPNLKGKWAFLSLDRHSRDFDGSLADPAIQEIWVNKLHERMGVDYTYGGYLEHRDHLLREQYNAGVGEDHFWHLGIDYNVPTGTPVSMPVDGELGYATMDPDHDGGWGGKLIFKVKDKYLVLGHLDEIVREKRNYRQGEVVAKVANYPTNGNWFPHLHVQCCSKFNPEVDGYSHYYEGIENDFPHPNELVKDQFDVHCHCGCRAELVVFFENGSTMSVCWEHAMPYARSAGESLRLGDTHWFCGTGKGEGVKDIQVLVGRVT